MAGLGPRLILTIDISSVANGVLLSMQSSPTSGDPLGQAGSLGPIYYPNAVAALDDVPRVAAEAVRDREMRDERVAGRDF